MNWNQVSDSSDRVSKYTLNVPISDYHDITKICVKRRIHRSVWFREAIESYLKHSFNMQEEIKYHVMRHTGEIRADNIIPKVEKCTTTSSRIDHGYHSYPGAQAGLGKNSFVLNLFRKEKTENI